MTEKRGNWHKSTDGHNPHAHIMLTVHPLDEHGKWQYKTKKEYLCVRNGEERGFTSAEFKAAQTDGWEKQYQYKVGKKKVYMPPSVAEAIESLREKMIVFRYQVRHIISGKEHIEKNLKILKPELTRYVGIANQIKEKSKERKALLAEKKAMPMIQIPKHRELSRRIAELTEELEELRSEKALLLQSLQYAELQEQAAEFDPDELMSERLAIRPDKERSATSRVQSAYGIRYQPFMMYDSKRDVSEMLGEETETRSIRERLRRKQQTQTPQQEKPLKSSRIGAIIKLKVFRCN